MASGKSKLVASKLTPVLVVPEVEPCRDFWLKLGFAVQTEVPHDGHVGFVILVQGGVELMYQSEASVAADLALAGGASTNVVLFVEVESLDATQATLGDTPLVVERRKTFYGSEELGVREPGGNLVMFAEF